jgi:hypothetical protein
MNPLGIDQRRIVVAARASDGAFLAMGQLVPLAPGLSEVRSVVVDKHNRCVAARRGCISRCTPAGASRECLEGPSLFVGAMMGCRRPSSLSVLPLVSSERAGHL